MIKLAKEKAQSHLEQGLFSQRFCFVLNHLLLCLNHLWL